MVGYGKEMVNVIFLIVFIFHTSHSAGLCLLITLPSSKRFGVKVHEEKKKQN